MMLLRQFPQGSMSVSMSSFSFPSFDVGLPSNSSILLSLLASVVLLSFIRAAFLCFRKNVGSTSKREVTVQVVEKKDNAPQQTQQRRSSWAWGLLSWQSLPTLPVSLKMTETSMHGKGVGLQPPSQGVEAPSQNWQGSQSPRVRRAGPAFETPVPALYQSDVPVSMAKIIMSRHTYRKPTHRPPPRPLLPSSSSSRLSSPPPSSRTPPPPSSSHSSQSRRNPSMV